MTGDCTVHRLRRPGVNNAFIGCHRLGLCNVSPQGHDDNEEEDFLGVESDKSHDEVRASLLDEVGVLYFVAKARDAFRNTRRG